MIVTNHLYHAPGVVLQKLSSLFSTLCVEKANCQQAASKIRDLQLRKSLLQVAQECNQFAGEVQSQIEMLGGHVEEIPSQMAVDETEPGNQIKEIFKYCLESEKRIIRAYREVLNDAGLLQGVRKIMRHQLNEFLCAFLSLKILSTSL